MRMASSKMSAKFKFIVGANDATFDLVLADPPYADDDWVSLLDVLDARWVVAEAGRELEPHPRWDVVREKAYGSTVVTVLKRKDTPQ